MVELDPWNEVGQRRVLRALTKMGQRNAALIHYENYRGMLGTELGVEPEETTIALYERIRDGYDLAEEHSSIPSKLPPQSTPFVGREELLAEITARLSEPDCRLLSLIGPGGSGKTRLALEVAKNTLRQFEHGVFFVSLEPLEKVEEMVSTLARFHFSNLGLIS